MKTRTSRMSTLVGAVAATALFVSACGGNGGNDGDPTPTGEASEAITDPTDSDPTTDPTGSGGTIELGIIPSWTDGLATAYLWEAILEDEGYEVNINEINDAAPLYTSVARGDFHVYPSAWPEVTHADYMARFGDDLEDLGAYYEGAVLTLAVPSYTEINSIDELNDNVDLFGGTIYGIEPGAGLTDITLNSVMPEYGLSDNYSLQESSTSAMLTELRSAVDAERDIVVTLWRPFWANTAFDVKDLEDPLGAFGEPETLNLIAHEDFSSEFPEVAAMMSNFSLSDELFGELEDLVTVQHEGDPAAGARAFLDAHPDFVDGLKN